MNDQVMGYGDHMGFRFSWIVANRPGYVVWARTQPSPMRQTRQLVQYADHLAADNIPSNAFLDNTGNDTMRIGGYRGKTFEWIHRHASEYVDGAELQVPRCSTEWFRLVQYARNVGGATPEVEQAWAELRRQHRAHMRARAIDLGETF